MAKVKRIDLSNCSLSGKVRFLRETSLVRSHCALQDVSKFLDALKQNDNVKYSLQELELSRNEFDKHAVQSFMGFLHLVSWKLEAFEDPCNICICKVASQPALEYVGVAGCGFKPGDLCREVCAA